MSTVPTNFVDNTGMYVNAAYLNNLGTEVNANTAAKTLAGTYASRPAASSSNSGANYFCTDTDKLYRSDGTTWTLIRMGGWGGHLPLGSPAAGTGTTTLGPATFTSDRDDRVLTAPSVTGPQWWVEYQALSPTTNYTVTAYLTQNLPTANYLLGGLFVRNSASGKMISFGPAFSSQLLLAAYKVDTETSGGPPSYATTSMTPASMPNWYRIRDDGTNRYYEYSYDGWSWYKLTSTLRTDYITPDQFGFGADYQAPGTLTLRCRSLKVTTP